MVDFNSKGASTEAWKNFFISNLRKSIVVWNLFARITAKKIVPPTPSSLYGRFFPIDVLLQCYFPHFNLFSVLIPSDFCVTMWDHQALQSVDCFKQFTKSLFYFHFQMTKALKNIRNALKMDMNQSFFLHLLALILSSQKKVSYSFMLRLLITDPYRFYALSALTVSFVWVYWSSKENMIDLFVHSLLKH